jgi:hypothetical protein
MSKDVIPMHALSLESISDIYALFLMAPLKNSMIVQVFVLYMLRHFDEILVNANGIAEELISVSFYLSFHLESTEFMSLILNDERMASLIDRQDVVNIFAGLKQDDLDPHMLKLLATNVRVLETLLDVDLKELLWIILGKGRFDILDAYLRLVYDRLSMHDLLIAMEQSIDHGFSAEIVTYVASRFRNIERRGWIHVFQIACDSQNLPAVYNLLSNSEFMSGLTRENVLDVAYDNLRFGHIEVYQMIRDHPSTKSWFTWNSWFSYVYQKVTEV